MTVAMRARRWRRQHLAGVLAPGDGTVLVGGGVAVVVAVGGFWAFATGVDPDTWVPLLLVICLTTISVPLCLWLGRGDRRLRTILLVGLALKLLCVVPRYAVNEYLYDGEADAGNYHQAGTQLYQNVREDGEWSLEGAVIEDYSAETRAVGYFTGTLYLVVGTTYFGGYLVFGWVCWIGMVFTFRAFRVAFPNAPPHLAAALIFFLPSMLYWPSTVGKDVVMVLSLGVMTLGLARLLTPDRPLRGLALLLPSAWLMLQVRPHLLLIVMVGAAAGSLAWGSRRRRTAVSIASRVLVLAALVPGLMVGLSRVDDAFGATGEEGGFSVGAALDQTSDQTSIGSSAFETEPVDGPLDVPLAVVSVLYRPFPFEVQSLPVLVSSLEGTALLVATFLCGRWIWRVGPAAFRHPFAAFCAAYVLAFVFAFSNIGNAGILARQRTQMFPVLMLLVAAAREHHRMAVELPVVDEHDDEVPTSLAGST